MYLEAIFSLLVLNVANANHLEQIRGPIDLSWSFDENSVSWPGVKSFMYTRKIAEYRDDGTWYAMNEFCTGEHGGTHLDAPYHFSKSGWKVADIPLTRLMTQGIVVDISEEVKQFGPQVELRPDHLEDWQRTYGPLPIQCVLLVRFGWSQFYTDYDKYMGKNESGLNFPGISREAAQWIVESESIVGVGVDTSSVDKGQSTSFDAHRILAAHQIFNMENVNVCESLPARGFNLIVMPMKLKDGSGAPLRIIATPGLRPNDYLNNMPTMAPILNSVPWYGRASSLLCFLLLLGLFSINLFVV